MNFKFLLAALFIFSSILYSQTELTAGMGINFVSQASLKDYINRNFGNVAGDKLNTFFSSVEFNGEGTYSISDNFDLGLEYAQSIFSYNTSLGYTVYDLSYTMHKPSLVAYYVIPGKGYEFKFGGGIGLRFLSLTEKIAKEVDFSSVGWGVLGRIEGHTSLTNNLYAVITGDIRVDLPGDAKDSNDKNFVDGSGEIIGLNSIAFGVKLGISYHF